jgi:hypothetical protein
MSRCLEYPLVRDADPQEFERDPTRLANLLKLALTERERADRRIAANRVLNQSLRSETNL